MTTVEQDPVPDPAPDLAPPAPTPTPAPDPFPAPLRAALVAAGALTVILEVDRLVGGLAAGGRTHTFAEVVAPASLFTDPGSRWASWAQAVEGAELVWYAAAHVVADLVFVLAYVHLVRRLIGLVSGTGPRRRRAGRLLRALVLLEVLEAVLLVSAAVQATSAAGQDGDPVTGPTFLVPLLAWVALLKWLAALGLAWSLLRSPELRARLGAATRRLVWGRTSALWYQRLSVLMIAVTVGLSVLPGADVVDQLPDVQRAWFPGQQQAWWSWHAVAATALTGVLFLALLVVGRQRTQRAHRTHVLQDPPGLTPQPPSGVVAWVRSRLWWFVGPVAVVAVAALLLAVGRSELVGWRLAAGFALVPLALLGASAALDRWAPVPPAPVTTDPGRHRDAWQVGDALAGLLLALAAVGLLRSMTAPVLLRFATGDQPEPGQVVSLVAGALVLGLGAPWATRVVARALPRSGRAGRVTGPVHAGAVGVRLQVGALVAASAVLVGLLLWPRGLSDWLGVIGTVQLAALGWLVVLAFPVLHLQGRPPLAVFRRLGLQATPVLTLLVVVPLLVQLVPATTSPRLHAVGAPSAADAADAAAARDTLGVAFADWVRRTAGTRCSQPVAAGGAVRARPLVLVAAAGGGIRAAAWTAEGMEALASTPCGTDAVFLGSGVSGGSVGLVAARAEDPTEVVAAIRDHRTLSAGVAGLLVGDVVGGSTGLLVPAWGDGLGPAGADPSGPDGRWQDEPWRDRAALMEQEWRSAQRDSPLAEPFLGGEGPELVLNSTATSSGCRVLVSTVELRGVEEEDGADPRLRPGQGPVAGRIDCRGATTDQLPGAVDLVDLLGPSCVPELDGATAAMLSARFPVVTPAGRVPHPEATGCQDLEAVQLIDGGYAEGSGLATVSDLLPPLMVQVAEHNAGHPGDLVVPVVVLLHNRPGADLAPAPPRPVLEPLVPLEGRKAKAQFGTEAVWLQRISQQIADPCGEAEGCESVVRDWDREVGGRVVVSAPQTEPAVEPPLGWVLSDDSQDRLESAAHLQRTRCLTVDDYGCLRSLLELVGGS